MRTPKSVRLALALILFTTVPATAEPSAKQHRLVERSFHPLLNDVGNMGPPAVQVTADDRLFAYVGTFHVNTCHSTHQDHEAAGVKVVELTDPDVPVLVGVIPTEPGGHSKDVRRTSVTVDGESRELLVVSRQACPGTNAVNLAGSPGSEQPTPWTGFEIHDITVPGNPFKLGEWDSGGFGVHNLSVFARPDLQGEGGRVPMFVAATYWEEGNTWAVETADGLQGEPAAFKPSWLKIVEITDPAEPTLVGTWGVPDEDEATCLPRGQFNEMFCALHDVQVSDDGRTAYLAYQDAGVVLLDITDPADPALIGQWFPPEDRCEVGKIGDNVDGVPCEIDEDGLTHTVVPVNMGGRHLVLVTDEEISPPVKGFLRVVDVTDPDPSRWRQIARYVTPRGRGEDACWCYAHQPWPGPTMPGGGTIYLGAQADGLRVLSLGAGGAKLREVAWFVPGPEDHADDVEQDPYMGQFDNAGFEGSTTILHPSSGELLILAVDAKRGLYVLEPSDA